MLGLPATVTVPGEFNYEVRHMVDSLDLFPFDERQERSEKAEPYRGQV